MNESYHVVARGLGSVTALFALLGWAAVPVVLVLTGKIKNAPPGSYNEAWDASSHQGAERFLGFVHDPGSGWVLVHVFFLLGAAAITFLPATFWSVLAPRDALAMPALVGATFGGLLAFLAVVYDMYGTPILARVVVTDADPQHKHAAWLVWRYVEQWRERCFKSFSLCLIGLWMMWLKLGLGWTLDVPGFLDGLLGWTSLVGGLLLLFLGITQAMRTRLFGQRGRVGILIMMPTVLVWASVAAIWFAL